MSLMGAQIPKMLNADIKIGLTEMAKVTGFSPSQIRYWEKKGYIQSEQGEQNKNHYFTLLTLYRVYTIKFFLDQGYTLQVAVKKEKQRQELGKIFQQFISKRIFDVRQTGDNEGEVILGPLDEDPTKEVYATVQRNGKTALHCRSIGDKD